MACDYLRSCYKTRIRPFHDSDYEEEIQWFFCDPDARPLPFYSRFASGNWASSRIQWDGPGEVLGSPRAYVDGAKPDPRLVGKTWCGSLTQFADGASVTDPLPPITDGLPTCCNIPPAVSVSSGQPPTFDYLVFPGCAICPGGIAATLYVQGLQPTPYTLFFYGAVAGDSPCGWEWRSESFGIDVGCTGYLRFRTTSFTLAYASIALIQDSGPYTPHGISPLGPSAGPCNAWPFTVIVLPSLDIKNIVVADVP